MTNLKPAKSTARATKGNGGDGGQPLPATPREYHRMVAEAAYYLAEQRGFIAGDPADDWLTAEAQIDDMFGVDTRIRPPGPVPGQGRRGS